MIDPIPATPTFTKLAIDAQRQAAYWHHRLEVARARGWKRKAREAAWKAQYWSTSARRWMGVIV